MMTRREANAGLASTAFVAGTSELAVAAAKIKELPSPRASGGKPLIDTLKLRRSIREYADRPLPPQVLSDLLWAAFGINRPSGDRTAPYWRHVMVIDVYAALADGVWLYDPAHASAGATPRDRYPQRDRHAGFRRDRPAQSRLRGPWRAHAGVSPEERRLYASVDTGFIGQNVYCSAHRRDLARCSAARSTPKSSRRSCGSVKASSSPSRRRSDIRGCERPMDCVRSKCASGCRATSAHPRFQLDRLAIDDELSVAVMVDGLGGASVADRSMPQALQERRGCIC